MSFIAPAEVENIFLTISMLETNKNNVMNILNNFKNNIYSDEFDEEKYLLYYNIPVSVNIYALTELLDEVLTKYPKTRYILKITYKNKKYFSSIRINKKGRKITTKKQTKLLSIL